MQKTSTVVVTGGAGYLGSVLVPILLSQGYRVRVIDRFFFGKKNFITKNNHKDIEIFDADTRSYPKKFLEKAYAVIDLAALADESICELYPGLAHKINVLARTRTARLAKSMGVARYIQASSCSVYTGLPDPCAETHAVNPQTRYSKSCLQAERGALKLNNKIFHVTILRLGSMYGLSPRMRFDLPVNKMVLSAARAGTITVVNGTQWRAILHVTDAACAFIACLETKQHLVGGQIFNIASANIQIIDLAKRIADTLPARTKLTVKTSSDYRSWRVSTKKIAAAVAIHTTKTLEKTVREMYKALKQKHVYNTRQAQTANWYKRLLAHSPSLDFSKK